MKWIHNLLKGASLTGALFVFQACYGSPQTTYSEVEEFAPMTFTLVNGKTGKPLKGISVQASSADPDALQLLGTTDAQGRCRVDVPYLRSNDGAILRFEDEKGRYEAKDTVLSDLRDREVIIGLENSK